MGNGGDELDRWRRRSRVAGTRRKMTAIGSGGDELDRCRREERQRHSATASRSSQPLRAQKGGPRHASSVFCASVPLEIVL
jgi:hypothetical protein